MFQLKSRLNSFTKNLSDTISEKAKAFAAGEVVLDEKDLQKPLMELQVALLENDVALEVAEEVVRSVKEGLAGSRKKLGTKTRNVVEEVLRGSLLGIIKVESLDFDAFIEKAEKPVKVVFVGVNGTGKTSTIAKVANRLKNNGRSVVLACADTFRAGAEEQIDIHASRLDLKLIKHQYGADPAAVVYDAIAYAKARKKDVVLADTAGRAHTNVNLMDQLRKICRVAQPDLIIFVDEATAGNDAVERAKKFNDALGISGSILTKFDTDARGGAAISIAYCTKKPILFVTKGQEYKDIEKFEPEWLVDKIMG